MKNIAACHGATTVTVTLFILFDRGDSCLKIYAQLIFRLENISISLKSTEEKLNLRMTAFTFNDILFSSFNVLGGVPTAL